MREEGHVSHRVRSLTARVDTNTGPTSDGQRVLWVEDGQLKSATPDFSRVDTISDAGDRVREARLSLNGLEVAYATDCEIKIVGVEGGGASVYQRRDARTARWLIVDPDSDG